MAASDQTKAAPGRGLLAFRLGCVIKDAGQWSLPSLVGKTVLTVSELMTPEVAETRIRSFFMVSYFVVAIGGALGSVARFWASGTVAERFGQTFPFGTLLVNVSGSFAIGFFAAVAGPEGRMLASPTLRQFFMIGVCGGYTTFSSFSLQTLALAREGEWHFAALNAIASFGLCLIAVWLGDYLAMNLNQR